MGLAIDSLQITAKTAKSDGMPPSATPERCRPTASGSCRRQRASLATASAVEATSGIATSPVAASFLHRRRGLAAGAPPQRNSTIERKSSANAAAVNFAQRRAHRLRQLSGSGRYLAAGERLGVEAVEPGGVRAGDLEAVLGAGVLEVARDDLLGMRPGRGLMRIVRRPHQLVDPDKVAVGDADIIIDVGGPHLALKIFAGLEAQFPARGVPIAFKGAVHALKVIGQPADVVFRRDD